MKHSSPLNYPNFKHEYLTEIELLNMEMPAWMHYPELKEQFDRIFTLKNPKKADVVDVYYKMLPIVKEQRKRKDHVPILSYPTQPIRK